jgi:hypothetical protein
MTQGVIEARAWLLSLACHKAKDHGYPHELWRLTVANRAALSFDTRAELIRDILCRLAAGSVVPRKMTCGPGSGLGRHKPCKVACHRALGTVHEDRHSLGQRFLDSNHIRRPRRACRTMCE